MKEVILWIFNEVSEFISTSMTWKIYGNFSFTHFVLAATFIFALFKFFGFASDSSGDALEQGISIYKNAENKKEKANYTHFLASSRRKNVYGGYDSVTQKFRVNKKTGEVERL